MEGYITYGNAYEAPQAIHAPALGLAYFIQFPQSCSDKETICIQ